MRKAMALTMVAAAVLIGSGCEQKSKDAVITEELDKMMTQEQENSAVMEVSSNATAPQQAAAAPAVGTAAPVVQEQVAAPAVGEKPTNQQIQEALKNAGLYSGKVDGSIGAGTKKAIRSFQAKNGLDIDGKVGRKTWQKLSTYLSQSAPSASTTTPEQTQTGY